MVFLDVPLNGVDLPCLIESNMFLFIEAKRTTESSILHLSKFLLILISK